MSDNSVLKRICTSLGKNNKPTYVVMTIALVKGICRPMFTMMDKTENAETKKYTAIREGLTEVIAMPTYFLCGEASEKLAKLLPKNLQERGGHNFMFIGVCAAALLVIPALCSLAIKPLMGKIQENNKKKHPPQQPLQSIQLPQNQIKPVFSAFSARPHYGMKVGGV